MIYWSDQEIRQKSRHMITNTMKPQRCTETQIYLTQKCRIKYYLNRKKKLKMTKSSLYNSLITLISAFKNKITHTSIWIDKKEIILVVRFMYMIHHATILHKTIMDMSCWRKKLWQSMTIEIEIILVFRFMYMKDTRYIKVSYHI